MATMTVKETIENNLKMEVKNRNNNEFPDLIDINLMKGSITTLITMIKQYNKDGDYTSAKNVAVVLYDKINKAIKMQKLI